MCPRLTSLQDSLNEHVEFRREYLSGKNIAKSRKKVSCRPTNECSMGAHYPLKGMSSKCTAELMVEVKANLELDLDVED